MNPLDLAVEAFAAPRERRAMMIYCAELAEYKVFSNRNLELITGLPERVVKDITAKTDHTGGRLNPDTLPLIASFRDTQAAHLLHRITEMGTSLGTVQKLTGIPMREVRRMAADKG